MNEQKLLADTSAILGIEVWLRGHKYIMAGAEYTLGESIADFLNLDIAAVDQPYSELMEALRKTPSETHLSEWPVVAVGIATDKTVDALFRCAPYKKALKAPYLGQLTDYFGERLTDKNAPPLPLDGEVMKTYISRFYELRMDVVRTQLLFGDFLDNYMRDAVSDAQGFERFLDEVDQKRYRDSLGESYTGQQLFSQLAPMDINFGIPPKESGIAEICEIIRFVSLFDFFYWELMQALMNGIRIRRCKHCGRFFVVDGGYAYEYCNHPAPGEETKTCREVGALRSHEAKIHNDPIWGTYRRAYKKYHARVHKKHMTQEEFLKWAERAIVLRDRAITGEIAVEELQAALDAPV